MPYLSAVHAVLDAVKAIIASGHFLKLYDINEFSPALRPNYS